MMRVSVDPESAPLAAPAEMHPVYVDAAIHRRRGARGGSSLRGARWGHLFCADLDQLHRFAARLGLRRAWFEEPPEARWPHYDITPKQRELAIQLGALAADRRTLVLVAMRFILAPAVETATVFGSGCSQQALVGAARERSFNPGIEPVALCDGLGHGGVDLREPN